MDTIARIRREFFTRGQAIKDIVRDLHVSRNTVRKVIRSGSTAFAYERDVQLLPKLGPWRNDLDRMLIAYAKAHPHPEERERTVWERFEAERAALVPYAGRFDGFHAITASVSTTCLVRFDNNRYSIAASAIGQPVEVRAYAGRIEIRQDGRVVAEHERVFGRDQTVFDPWHYVPVLARKGEPETASKSAISSALSQLFQRAPRSGVRSLALPERPAVHGILGDRSRGR